VSVFPVDLILANRSGDQWKSIQALVGTGSLYTWLPSDLLAQLGVQAGLERKFETPEGRHVVHDVGFIKVRLNGEEQTTLAVFGEPGGPPVLGRLTLDDFGLGIDQVNQRLVPVLGFALSGSVA